jgi:hypothetical protein
MEVNEVLMIVSKICDSRWIKPNDRRVLMIVKNICYSRWRLDRKL